MRVTADLSIKVGWTGPKKTAEREDALPQHSFFFAGTDMIDILSKMLLIFLDPGARIKCSSFSLSQKCLFWGFSPFYIEQGFVSQLRWLLIQRLSAEPPGLALPPPSTATQEPHLSLKALKPDDVLVGWRIFLPKVFSEGMDLHGELSLDFRCLQ